MRGVCVKKAKDVRVLDGAPEQADRRLFDEIDVLCQTTNCYAYAVQDYGAGYIHPLLPEHKLLDEVVYLPRPGQTTGDSYSELYNEDTVFASPAWCEKRKSLMRQALKKDGILYQGEKYPAKVPDDKYVICCFLVQNSYHFLRQNQDGSWSSKNGTSWVSTKKYNEQDEIGNDPEGYYNHRKDCPFVGYFFVPKGGIRVGLKQRLLKTLHLSPKMMLAYFNQSIQGEEKHHFSDLFAELKEYILKVRPVFEESYGIIDRIRSCFKGADGLSDKEVKLRTVKAAPLVYQLDHNLFGVQKKRVGSLCSMLKDTQTVSLKCRKKMKARS